MIGLDKIYLHHSVYPNKTTMIDCSGHHNSSGRNGSGKTTLQKLIPIFYGEAVNRVVPAQGTKDSFITYYLKSEASFVAFEYTNPSGKCCVVLHKKNDHLHYRFLTGELTDFFYTESTKFFLQKGKLIHEFVKELKSEGFPVSQIISIADDYRAILQNDKFLLRTRRQQLKNILELTNQYSLPGFNSNMQLMHKLTYALQTRTSMFSGLEDMIVSTQFDFSAPEKPRHADNKSLTDDLKSIHDFVKNEEIIKACIRKSDSRLRSESEKILLTRRLLELTKEQTEELKKLTHKKKSEEISFGKVKEQFDEELRSRQEVLSQLKSDHKVLDSRIESIHKVKAEWDEDKNIQYKIAQQTQIALLREQAESAEIHYKVLIDGISKEREAIDSKIKLNDDVLAEQKIEIRSKCVELNIEMEDYRKNIQNKQSIIFETRDKSLELETNKYTPKREKLIAECACLEEKSKRLSYTQEEEIHLESAEQGVLESTHMEEMSQDKLEDKNTQYQEEKKHYDKAEEHYSRLLKRIDEAKIHESTLHHQRFPNDSSLLGFLRKENPEWSETIGKLINPELLHRTDLSPVVEGGSNNFYGTSLELDNIELPEHAENNETLSNLHKEAVDEMTRQRDSIANKENELRKITDKLTEFDASLHETKQLHKRSKLARQAAQRNYEKVRSTNKDASIKRKKLSLEDVKAIKIEMVTVKEAHQNNIEDIKYNAESHNSELLGILAIKQSEIGEHLDNHNQKIDDMGVQNKEKNKELEDAFRQVCTDKGLDETIEKKAKLRRDETNKLYKDTKGYIDDITAYKAWVKSEWNELQNLEAEMSEKRKLLLRQRNLLDDTNVEFNNNKSVAGNLLKKLSRKINDLKELLDDARQLLVETGSVMNGDDKSDISDISILIELLRSEYNEYKRLTKETIQEVRRAQMLIERRQESRIFEQWQNLYNKYQAKSTYDDLDERFLLNLPPLFEDLIVNHLPQIRQSTLEAIIGVSGQIDHYYQELKNISKAINVVSNRLSSQINTNQQIDALSDISIKLVSKVEEIGAWKEMETFHRIWSKWTTTIERELPPESLGDALNEVVTALEYAHSKPDLKSMISLFVTLKENGNYREISSDKVMNDSSSNGLSLLAVIAIYIGMCRYLCPDERVSLTWPVDELSSIDLENISSLFGMFDAANIRLFSAFPTKEHNILKHFDTCDELDFKKGAMSMEQDLPQIKGLTDKLQTAVAVEV